MAPQMWQMWHSVRLQLIEADIYGYACLKEEIKELRLKIKLRKLRESETLSCVRKERKKKNLKRDLKKTRETLHCLEQGLDKKKSCIQQSLGILKESLGRVKEKYVTLVEVGDAFALRKIQLWYLTGGSREEGIYFEIGQSVKQSELQQMSLVMRAFMHLTFLRSRTLYFLSANNVGQATEGQCRDLGYRHGYSRYTEEDALRDSVHAMDQNERSAHITWQQLRYHLVDYGMSRCKLLEATLKLKKIKYDLHTTTTYDTAKAAYKSAKQECEDTKSSILLMLKSADLLPWITVLDTFDIHAIKRLRSWNDKKISFEIGSMLGSDQQLIVDLAKSKWNILLRPRTLYYVVAEEVGEADLDWCKKVGYPYTPGAIGIPLLQETARNGGN